MARLPILDRTDLPAEHRNLFAVDEDDPDDVNLNIHRVWANNPNLLDDWGEWTWSLYDEMGDSRIRELVILAVARTLECRYVWNQHVSLAATAGVSSDEIRAIADGTHSHFSAADRAVIEYAIAIVSEGVEDDSHRAIQRHYDAELVVTIAFLASEYAQIAMMIDAFDVELEDSFVGWSPADQN